MSNLIDEIKALGTDEQREIYLGGWSKDFPWESVVQTTIDERRWGPQIEYVVRHKATGTLIAFSVYSMQYNEGGGEDEVDAIYEVEPVEITLIEYRKKVN